MKTPLPAHKLSQVVTVFFLSVTIATLIGCNSDKVSDTPKPVDDTPIIEGPPPNIVVITLDTLRPDYLEMHGFERNTAPFLAKLAEDSVVFDNAYSTSSWTAPATASLFTSQYPTQHGLHIGFFYQYNLQRGMIEEKLKNASADHDHTEETAPLPDGTKPIHFQQLSLDATTLPEIMQSVGYTTYGISANPNIDTKLHFDQGFDLFNFKNNVTAEGFHSFLTQNKTRIQESGPYFLYLQMMDVHQPYHKRAPYFKEGGDGDDKFREAYLSEISYMDSYLEKLYNEFEWGSNTILVFVSDHGEEFWDHGGTNHGPTLYGELNHALTMFHAPDSGFSPRRVSENVSLIDILPTMIELVGGGDTNQNMQGESLVPLLKKDARRTDLESTLSDRVIFAHRVRDLYPQVTELWAAIHQDRKLIVDTKDGQPNELFDLNTDRPEKYDLSNSEPETYQRLFEELENFRSQTRVEASIGMEALDSELEDTLDALGYLD